MEGLKPIETVYKGYRFRSRLEARWAVFFDAMAMKYEYEPEGFVLEDGTKYLPDFYVEAINAYIEIKPVGAFKTDAVGLIEGDGREKYDKYKEYGRQAAAHHNFLILVGDPVDAFPLAFKGDGGNACWHSRFCPYHIMVTSKDVIVDEDEKQACEIGQNEGATTCYDCKIWACVWDTYALFISSKAIVLNHKSMPYCVRPIFIPYKGNNFTTADFLNGEIAAWARQDRYLRDDYLLFRNAAIEARQARFEHGETPDAEV